MTESIDPPVGIEPDASRLPDEQKYQIKNKNIIFLSLVGTDIHNFQL